MLRRITPEAPIVTHDPTPAPYISRAPGCPASGVGKGDARQDDIALLGILPHGDGILNGGINGMRIAFSGNEKVGDDFGQATLNRVGFDDLRQGYG